MSKYLLEIGTEEIPYRFMENTLNQMENNMKSLLGDNRIEYEEINVYGTPRRLTIIVDGINRIQSDLEEMVKGPSKKIAYDEEGEPTKALMGFSKGQGVEVEDIIVKNFNGDDYVFANKKVAGIETVEILKKSLSDYIKALNFPKPMKWGGKNIKFARPIRWLVSLMDNEIVEFDLEGIKASNKTRGHRFLGSSDITINNVDEYNEKLKENYVIVDQNKRAEIIKIGCEKLAKEKGGNLLKDDELLKELTYLVEYPTPLIGRIKKDYLNLPQEVIITPMKEHQRYFPILDDNNRLLPYFIAVRNGNKDYLDIVTKGNEKVIDARLEDAKFFYEEDTQKDLEEYVESLKNVVFQEKLGTVYEKTERIQELSIEMSKSLELGEETEENVKRASYLCKADLVTKMVNEFTELQGIMGREYAKKSEENEIVSLAIYEHYLPRFSEDELPTTTAGAVLSIADKIDNICGSFAIGIQPTGSQDPYGLRRQALGIINIILNKNLDFSISEFIDNSLRIYIENELYFDYDKVKTEVLEFFNNRIKNMFIDMGIRYDVVDSVISVGNDNIADLLVRAQELNKWVNKEELNEILTAFNRVVKIAAKSESKEINKELLKKEEEIKLYKVYREIKEEVFELIQKKEYDKALDKFVGLREPIDDFFDNVMVMVDDEEIKTNRLALIDNISDTMLQICDLSKITSA